ncbi:O-antigen polymerase [Thauera phenylacetica B4P]|uniref:O-antigen polymerase n=1 Tax=Thauera phenylacetica B4P TaxID=1234382 RepID=N6ZWN4_9RHOO|nr:O-antigen polymerase [Thauera phenylacetica B4P]
MLPSSSSLERWLVVSVLVLLVWMPLPLGSNRDWAVGVLVAWVGVIALGWVVLQWRQEPPVPRNPAWHPALGMALLLGCSQAWVAVQWLGGITVDTGATFQYLMLGLAYNLLFLLVIVLFHTRGRLTVLLATLVVSGALQAFYGAFMTLSGIEWLLIGAKISYGGDATGTFVNRNHLAGYLELTLACGIGLLLALRDGRSLNWHTALELLLGPKARLRLALIIMVIALVMTHSRGGNIGFFVGLFVAAGLFVIRNREHRVRNVAILLSIVLIDVLVISQYFGLGRLKDRLIETRLTDVVIGGEVVASANELRDDVLLQSIPLLKERPLLGHGAGSFEAVYPRFSDHTIPLHFDHAHNDYVQFGVEFGLLGSLPLALFVALALWHAFKALWRRDSAYSSGVGFGAAMGIISLAVHSGTDFNLQIPANAATFVVVCAIGVLAGHHSKRRARR